jgi:hypothetical protein
MPFNASDYIKPPAPEFATDREIQGDQVDLKINDLRRDTITCINALAAGAPSGSVTVDSISATPTTITAVKNLTPPVVFGGVGQRIVATSIGTMLLRNCSFDGTTFTADDTAAQATLLLVGDIGVTVSTQTDTTVPWTAWEFVETYSGGEIINSSTKPGAVFTVSGAFSCAGSPNASETVVAFLPFNKLLGFSPTLGAVSVAASSNTVGPYVATVVGQGVKVTFTTVAANTPSYAIFSVPVQHP